MEKLRIFEFDCKTTSCMTPSLDGEKNGDVARDQLLYICAIVTGYARGHESGLNVTSPADKEQ